MCHISVRHFDTPTPRDRDDKQASPPCAGQLCKNQQKKWDETDIG